MRNIRESCSEKYSEKNNESLEVTIWVFDLFLDAKIGINQEQFRIMHVSIEFWTGEFDIVWIIVFAPDLGISEIQYKSKNLTEIWFFRNLLFTIISTDDKNFIPVDDRTMILATALKPVQLMPTWSVVTRNNIHQRMTSNDQSALTRCYGSITKETKFIWNHHLKNAGTYKSRKFSPLVGNDVKILCLIV